MDFEEKEPEERKFTLTISLDELSTLHIALAVASGAVSQRIVSDYDITGSTEQKIYSLDGAVNSFWHDLHHKS